MRRVVWMALGITSAVFAWAMQSAATGGGGDDDLAFCSAQIERLQAAIAAGVEDLNARARAEDELDEALEAKAEEEVEDCVDALEEAFAAIGLSLRGPDPAAVRAAAVEAGLAPLSTVAILKPLDLNDYIRPGMEQVAVQLGKALFWDMQVGSDGKACGSCHFHAGADNRLKNQVNPGTKANDTQFGVTITDAGKAKGLTAPAFGPNYVLKAEDFPLRMFADAEEPNYNKRVLLRDTNDVISSQGVMKWRYDGIEAGAARDLGTPLPDDVFAVHGVNTRRVEPRHTPTMINAVFNSEQFWDGRAQNFFNGVNPFGRLDRNARILVVENGMVVERQLVMERASLASQAVGPPLSEDEMSYTARSFPDLGKKLLALRPLATQEVHPQDSVLGPLSRAINGQLGLTTASYTDLVRAVFQPLVWESTQLVTFEGDVRSVRTAAQVPAGAKAYSLMEANFALIFGLAIQMYETTLISDQTPFDAFLAGDDKALDADQLVGLLTFINRGTAEQKANPIFQGVRQGNCVACHVGPELTQASNTFMGRGIHLSDQPAAMVDGRLVVGTGQGALLLDRGFSNIGVRPTAEDIGHGGAEFGIPFSRQPLARLDLPPNAFEVLVEGQMVAPQLGIPGSFKIPGLRNVELTGPYFHNGGMATLGQVVEFYDRFGDFADVNIKELDVKMALVDLEEDDEVALIKLMLAMTDERVRNEAAPFDRPQLFVPMGHPGDQAKIECATGFLPCEDRVEVPAVGRGGRTAKGLLPLQPFLNVVHLDERKAEEDEEEDAE